MKTQRRKSCEEGRGINSLALLVDYDVREGLVGEQTSEEFNNTLSFRNTWRVGVWI